MQAIGRVADRDLPLWSPAVIPPVAHFIWYGSRFDWVSALAIRSACARGDFERVVLHHDSDLTRTPHWAALLDLPQFEARALVPDALFERAPVDTEGLLRLHDGLTAPNARANVVRAAILSREGGVYLDLDTVTVRSIAPLLDCGVFCGHERIIFPAALFRARSPILLARAGLFAAWRGACRMLPGGWRAFRRVEHWYPLAVNNAVLGAAPDHPFMKGLLTAMLEVPESRKRVPYALGTHLLQDRVAAYAGHDLVVHPAEVFYPLGPEISQHWFRKSAPPPLDDVLHPETRVVHWYASVRTKRLVPKIDPEYVRRNADRQLFSALARPFV